MLYNLQVPEIPVRRPSKQIKNSAHYSTATKEPLLDRRIEKLLARHPVQNSNPHPAKEIPGSTIEPSSQKDSHQKE